MFATREVTETETFIAFSFLTVAASCDARDYRVPNKLIGLGYLAGLYINIADCGLAGIPVFLAKAAWPILLLYILYVLGGLGAGDIKLFSVISAVVGGRICWKLMLVSVMLAGVPALLILVSDKVRGGKKLHFTYYMTLGLLLITVWEELMI